VVEHRTGGGSGDPATPADLRGEELADPRLPEPEAYTIAADEHEAEELTDHGPDTDVEVEIDDPSQLADAEEGARGAESSEPESLVAGLRQSRPKRLSAAVAKKDAPTQPRRRSSARPAQKRTTPREFVGQSVDELKKVVWPTPQQVRQYFGVVLVFVLFIMAFVVALDTGFGALLLKLFG
jgi:preprotein translocase subunit SecE